MLRHLNRLTRANVRNFAFTKNLFASTNLLAAEPKDPVNISEKSQEFKKNRKSKLLKRIKL